MIIKGELLLDAILRAFFALTVFLLWGCGPVSTGVAYVLRNYARREHAWIWADYIAAIKDNFKQGVAMLIMDRLDIGGSFAEFHPFDFEIPMAI